MLCPVMQMDFTDGTGRYCPETGAELYDDRDLLYGITWAEHHLAEGITLEPMKGYDLRAFGDWCRAQLAGGGEAVYLLHFDRPYKHARHYLGWTRDLPRRVARHLRSHGSRLVQVVLAAGIGVRVARTWAGGRVRERQLKKRGGRARLCPICRGAAS